MPILLFAALAALSLLTVPVSAQDQKTKDMTFVAVDASSLCGDCSVVQASGEISEKTIEAYYDFVWRGRFKKNIYFVFDSPGGNINAAIRLGSILRNLKVNTVVGRAFLRDGEIEIEPGHCASACALAFIGGATRSMPSGSKLGVHRWMPATLVDPKEIKEAKAKKAKPLFWDREVVEELHQRTALYLKYIETMGVDLRLGVLLLRTPYSDIAWVNARDQKLWSLVTVDSCLSTPGDRRRTVLFLPRNAPPSAAKLPASPQTSRERASL